MTEVLVADNGNVIAFAYANEDIVYDGRGLGGIVAEDQRPRSLENAFVFEHREPFRDHCGRGELFVILDEEDNILVG